MLIMHNVLCAFSKASTRNMKIVMIIMAIIMTIYLRRIYLAR